MVPGDTGDISADGQSSSEEIDPKIPEILQMNHVRKLLNDESRTLGYSVEKTHRIPIPGNISHSSIVISPINTISPPSIVVENKNPNSHRSVAFSFLGCVEPEPDSEMVVFSDDFADTYELRKIGPYRLTKTLGYGSTSKVKLGVHEKTGQKIAIKIIPRERMRKRDQKTKGLGENILTKEARLLREVTLLSLLFHPHIVNLYGYYCNRHYYILFMEYVEGGPLLEYILKHGRCTEKMARKLFRQLISAVNYCHCNGIVHRDLKVENILLDSKGKLKLIDFGLSNFYQNPDNVSGWNKPVFDLLDTFCGSLYYAAPELLKGKPYVGPEIDVWSLGVILFVLTTGKVPFDDKLLSVLHDKIREGKPVYPEFLSPPLVNLLKSMINPNPKERVSMESVICNSWVNNFPDQNPKGYPLVDSYLLDRYPISTLDRNVVSGIVQSLGCRYSYSLVYTSLEQAISDWEIHKDHPFIHLYYLVKEKLKRWNEFEKSFGARKSSEDMGLSQPGRKYRDGCSEFPERNDTTSTLRLYVCDGQGGSSTLYTVEDDGSGVVRGGVGSWLYNLGRILVRPFLIFR